MTTMINHKQTSNDNNDKALDNCYNKKFKHSYKCTINNYIDKY